MLRLGAVSKGDLTILKVALELYLDKQYSEKHIGATVVDAQAMRDQISDELLRRAKIDAKY